ncbi:MAG TPA: hypothetical protein VFR95_10390 [Gemmatimonadaceae bacterium]|nr:hypothetical protein [Gemmatimonadaceae bacterium]
MSEETTITAVPRRRESGTLAERARGFIAPIVAVVLFIFLYWGNHQDARAAAGAVQRITLSQKDAHFNIIPPVRGGAVGSVWYRSHGPALSFQLLASGLRPRRRYLLELSVDGTVYTVASHAAGVSGELSIDTTMTMFGEGACVGDNYDPPRSVHGEHEVKFWLKNDGNPLSGTMPGQRRQSAAAGSELPCRGNGDGDYSYVLLENEVAHFRGD